MKNIRYYERKKKSYAIGECIVLSLVIFSILTSKNIDTTTVIFMLVLVCFDFERKLLSNKIDLLKKLDEYAKKTCEDTK